MRIYARLSIHDITYLKREAKDMEVLEREFLRSYSKELSKYEDQVFKWMAHHDRPDPDVDLMEFVIREFAKIIKRGLYDQPTKVTPAKLSKNPRRIPSDLPGLRRWYDACRRKPPARIKRVAEKLKTNYLERIHETWKKASEDWRAGRQWTQDKIRESIRRAADASVKRATVIASTETTNFYNRARRARYDEVEFVTHYLFVAVRDAGTTPWCTDKTINGKRGRHGLVYAKGSELLEKETPACHWNCRSQLLPLVRTNPVHKRLIEDESLRRENHKCHPLPEGWSK